MPISRCKIHGETGVVEMCKHLHKELEKGIYSTPYELPIQTTRMCAKCFEKYGVQEIIDSLQIDPEEIDELRSKENGVYAIAPDAHFQIAILEKRNKALLKKIKFIYNDIARKRGWKCIFCIDQIRLDHARNNDLPLPFEPFEHTLMIEEDKRVHKLERALKAYLNPDGLSLTEREKDWDIEYGSLREPFTITVSGVLEGKDQRAVLKIIDKFFKKIPQKQRTVIFRARKNWITEEGKGTYCKTPRRIAEFTVWE